MFDWLKGRVDPLPEEVAQAAQNPGGYVYRIAGDFAPSEAVPPDAIAGAWKVDERGTIVGRFVRNPKFDAAKYR